MQMHIHQKMKEDVSTSVETAPLSTIFKELAKLERDFRYQETLCKIRTEELEKANATNVILKEHLEKAYCEIETLRNNVQSLDHKYTELDLGNSKEKDICEQVINKLTTKISTLTDEHRLAFQKQDTIYKQALSNLQEKHGLFLKDLQDKYGRDLLKFEQELDREKNHSKQLKHKLDFTIEDNLLLQNKLREVHQEYLPLEAYKTQLRNVVANNEKLKSQLSHLKLETKTIMNENAHLQKHNMRLNQMVGSFTEETEKKKLDHQEIVTRVQLELRDVKEKYDILLVESAKLKEDNAKSVQEMQLYKGDYCNMETHQNISEQNQILQELVKEMRKERMKCSDDLLQANLNETEARIQRLEELIFELKKVLSIRVNDGRSSVVTYS